MKSDTKIDLTKCVSRFSWRIKGVRLVWSYFFWPLVRHIPFRAGSEIRIFVLRLFGAKIGPTCLIEPGVRIWIPWRLRLDGYVALGREVEIYNYDWVSVGRMTVISQYTYLCTGTHDYCDPHFPLIWKPITIGSEVWIAAGVFLAPGVSVGSGAVIGAMSVVAKSVSPWTVNAGNPCGYIRDRVLAEKEP